MITVSKICERKDPQRIKGPNAPNRSLAVLPQLPCATLFPRSRQTDAIGFIPGKSEPIGSNPTTLLLPIPHVDSSRRCESRDGLGPIRYML